MYIENGATPGKKTQQKNNYSWAQNPAKFNILKPFCLNENVPYVWEGHKSQLGFGFIFGSENWPRV